METSREPPERIFGWRDSQLSVARHFGGISFRGHEYVIAYLEEGQPLVRLDVMRREQKNAAKELIGAARPVDVRATQELLGMFGEDGK